MSQSVNKLASESLSEKVSEGKDDLLRCCASKKDSRVTFYPIVAFIYIFSQFCNLHRYL